MANKVDRRAAQMRAASQQSRQGPSNKNIASGARRQVSGTVAANQLMNRGGMKGPGVSGA